MARKVSKPKRWLGLSELLKAHRKKLGFTQAEAASILNWSGSYYAQVEAGFVRPGSDARRLALGRFLGWIRSDDDQEGREHTREWFAGDGPRSSRQQDEAEQRRKRVAHIFKRR